MKVLLVLLAAACFFLVPVVAQAGNINPALYLEVYQYGTDPDDPESGCAVLGTCPEICHLLPPPWGLPHCYSAKAPYMFGIVPIHVCKLDQPIAEGWPLPCGPGGGYVTFSGGIAASGVAVTFIGVGTCPNFLQGPGTPPAAILVSATSKCHDQWDYPAYAKYLSTTNLGATYFDLIPNADDGILRIINCQIGSEFPEIIGRAQWGGTQTLHYCSTYTAVEQTTWGKIKGLYR